MKYLFIPTLNLFFALVLLIILFCSMCCGLLKYFWDFNFNNSFGSEWRQLERYFQMRKIPSFYFSKEFFSIIIITK